MTFFESLFYFFSFQDSNVNNVLIGTALLGISAGAVGSFVVLNKKSLVIDAVSHSMLPGVCLGFLLSGVKSPLYLLMGGIITSSLSLGTIQLILNRTKLKQDAAIAISLSFWFAMGVLLLGAAQSFGNGEQSGLSDFLFGKAASMTKNDLRVFVTLSVISITCIFFFRRHFKLFLFDKVFSTSIGVSKFIVQSLSSFLIIITTAAGIQTVGIVLMSAMVIAPTATALLWARSFEGTIISAAIIGMLGAVIGVFLSFLAPNMPTGPWIIVVLCSTALLSIVLAPKGLLRKKILSIQNKKRVRAENLLKHIYKFGTDNQITKTALSTDHMNASKILLRNNLLVNAGENWLLTEKGLKEAKRVVRIHRLWELYLEQHLSLPADFVHKSAESLEHIITPEIEKELSETMGHPKTDPHKQIIPYD